MNITIKQLSPWLINDYLYFFDNMVFSENPDWEKCYCYSFHFTGSDSEWKKDNNREAVIQLIKEGNLKGYLAYENKIPVGWCNVNDRQNYQRLGKIYELDDEHDEKVASIVCFLISPEFRGKGIATQLLHRIIKDYETRNYNCLEVYPSKMASTCEKNYKGPFRMYVKHGFVTMKSKENYHILRKTI